MPAKGHGSGVAVCVRGSRRSVDRSGHNTFLSTRKLQLTPLPNDVATRHRLRYREKITICDFIKAEYFVVKIRSRDKHFLELAISTTAPRWPFIGACRADSHKVRL